jgi:hypothetical protein
MNDMEYFLKQLKKLRDAILLDVHRKADIRTELAGYLRATRVVRDRGSERQSMVKRSPIFTNNKKAMQFAVAIAIMVLLGGGTSIAADRALPGDALYAVKVNVNEQVRAALTFSADAKAKLNAQLAEERLREAAVLAAEGKLDAATEAELRSSFQASAAEAQSYIQTVKVSGKAGVAAEINADFVSALEAQAQAMQAIRAEAEAAGSGAADVNADALVDLTTTVNSVLDASVDSSAEASGSLEVGL